jgi:redox-sensitive bicupin YhaK (pirin superfamily)
MREVFPASRRFHTQAGWLDSRHTFSFGEHHDPARQGLGNLLVINDDRVQPGQGFGTHGHRDMEIVSYVLEGALEHKDSTGTHGVIRPGDVQWMTAGQGVRHSEFNGSKTDEVHFLQLWILPNRRGHAPKYDQRSFTEALAKGGLVAIVSGRGIPGAIPMHADADLYAARLPAGATVEHTLRSKNGMAYLHVATGKVRAGDATLATGDGLGMAIEKTIVVEALEPSEVILFDLA